MRVDFFKLMKLLGFPVEEAREKFSNIKKQTEYKTGQNDRAWDIFNYHYNHNSFYRDFVKTKPTQWPEVPVIKRADLRGNFIEKLPQGTNVKQLYLSNTSGSSGDPLFFARDRLFHTLVWHNVEYFYNKAGVSVNDRQARMFGMSRSFIPRLKARLKDALSNRYRFNVFDLSDIALEGWIRKFKKENFKYIYGYTNSLVAFAQYLKSKNIVLASVAKKLKACIVTSEVCTDKDAAIIEEAFGIPVFNEYGSSELGIMGFKRNGFWEASDDLIFYEVTDEDGNILPDGELGYLTCTALYNKATPFIRYRIGDLASIRRINGRTRIENIMGSLNDMAILPSGKKVPGISFYFVAQNLIESSSVVKEFLFRQTPEGFEFEYVADRDLNNTEFEMIKKGFDINLEKNIPLVLKRVDALQRGANGKFKHFISSI